MAYNSTNPVAVGAATKKDHYDRVFDNTAALYAGAMSIPSQAAYGVPYFGSATQLTALAKAVGLLQSDGVNAPAWSPTVQPYSETLPPSAPTISGGTLTLNLATANHFPVVLDADIATLTISGVPASGKAACFVLAFQANGTPHTAAWPASVFWAYDVEPVLTSTNGHWDFFTFLSYDGGTTWFGFTMGQNHG